MIVNKDVPRHIAIIMDGNGRWAKNRNLPRFRGHVQGARRVEELALFANQLGIEVLTLYTFSTENWHRPQQEVSMLMKMLCSILDKRVDKLKKSNIRLSFVGSEQGVPHEVLKSIKRAIEITKQNTGLILNLAFNYGSRMEIIEAVKEIATQVQQGRIAVEDINEELLSQMLYTAGLPDPDLLIRTSGEKRISNFLLWQLSYTEMYFTSKCWPDFDEKEFQKALVDYQRRERRFGKV